MLTTLSQIDQALWW